MTAAVIPSWTHRYTGQMEIGGAKILEAIRVAASLLLFLGGIAFASTQQPAEMGQPQKVKPELNLKAVWQSPSARPNVE